MARVTELSVNGGRRIDVDPDRTLRSVLRDDLDLTGTKFGCGEGQCAACTVLVDGVATKSCLTKVGAMAGKRIVTIEGLAPEGNLHPVQQAFLDADAMHCGYCTPGMILGAVSLLGRTPNPSEAEIVGGMNGHICRWRTYPRVVRAIHAAAGNGGRASSGAISSPYWAAALWCCWMCYRMTRSTRRRPVARGAAAERSRCRSAPGCTSARRAWPRSTRARWRWARTRARLLRRRWWRNCTCRPRR